MAQPPFTSPPLSVPHVACDDHGSSPACILCSHLGDGRGLGFWSIKPGKESPAQAWCEACDAILEVDRGWTDRGDARADWQIYCTQCYRKTLRRHTRLGWDAG
jgi:hypothetical protein